jgi:hypothetical protein
VNTGLELAPVEDLIEELIKRYSALLILGVHIEDPDRITKHAHGKNYVVAGLMAEASCELSDRMAFPEDEEDE